MALTSDLDDRDIAVLRALDDAERTHDGLFPTLRGLQIDYFRDKTTARLAQVMSGLIAGGLAEANEGDLFTAIFRLTDKGRAALAQEG